MCVKPDAVVVSLRDDRRKGEAPESRQDLVERLLDDTFDHGEGQRIYFWAFRHGAHPPRSTMRDSAWSTELCEPGASQTVQSSWRMSAGPRMVSPGCSNSRW